jgi:hypothetical protein
VEVVLACPILRPNSAAFRAGLVGLHNEVVYFIEDSICGFMFCKSSVLQLLDKALDIPFIGAITGYTGT